jgi:hypothetical protein
MRLVASEVEVAEVAVEDLRCMRVEEVEVEVEVEAEIGPRVDEARVGKATPPAEDLFLADLAGNLLGLGLALAIPKPRKKCSQRTHIKPKLSDPQTEAESSVKNASATKGPGGGKFENRNRRGTPSMFLARRCLDRKIGMGNAFALHKSRGFDSVVSAPSS